MRRNGAPSKRQIPARLILARDGFPYLGGSSTILYLLFEILQQRMPNAECWNIITPRVWEMGRRNYGPHWPNPRQLPNVRTFLLDQDHGKAAIRRALREHPVAAVLSKSRRTTPLLKKLAPEIPVWHLTSTCSIIKNAIAAQRFTSMEAALRQLRRREFPSLRCQEELEAVRAADHILFHTRNMKFWYYTFYPRYRDKMQDEIFWDYPILLKQFEFSSIKRIPWRRRPIDLLFVASDWRRAEKNFALMKRLCQVFHRKKIMVIGYLPEPLPPSVITFDSMSQWDVVQAMGRTKVLVSPSRYDEAPNVLFEAAIAGANIVCSRNCGNYQLAPEELVPRLEAHDFEEKIRKAFQGYRAPRTEPFTRYDISEWVPSWLLRNGRLRSRPTLHRSAISRARKPQTR